MLDSITVQGTLNASINAFKKTVQYYVRDQNKERRKYYKKERKQIMVEFGNWIFEDDPEFKIAAYFDVGEGSFISFNGDQAVKVPIEQEKEITLDNLNKTIEINENDLSNSELDNDN